ncbi:glycoside hydrolase family 13 protein [uncultured Nocardioides sp.]|uniref:glycoside hydrolase family 13 protein n=1 Tax=uncultured Nocardioides sp. TaxID=198441 RepID=UPI0025E1D41F|nr:glycoside hydrolase family 13 protein [uncultured Nocardioides sp.]
MTLLDDPHHDGSATYVDLRGGEGDAPVLGSRVGLRMASSPQDPIDQVWIRTTYDAEPTYHRCTREEDGSWTGSIPVHNPVTHYRFLIVRGAAQEWLNGAGLVDRDVPDAYDFKLSAHRSAPEWARHGVVYQIFPDRFARSEAADHQPTPPWAVPAQWDDEVYFESDDPRTPLQLFGGDLDGITDHLDHVAEVGADIVYTTPIFPGESNHRYNASTFTGADPLLGGDEAYERLGKAVHARGWRILGDLTTNHTGDTHEWFRTAVADPGSPERGYYYFDDRGYYECWMGHRTLPKVNHGDPALRSAMVEGPDSVVGRWLQQPFDLDGWRIDVANMTGRLGAVDDAHEVARAVRRTAEALREDAWVIGEHNHDATADVAGDGWHGVMNYSGFSWPVWSWLVDPASPARPFGRPVSVPRRPGPAVVATLREWQGTLGWRATANSWNILGSHDSPRIRTLVGSAGVHRVAAGLQLTMPGVPMIFAGDEIGLEGVLGEDARRPMPWHRRSEWDDATLATYSALTAVRREQPALREGGLRWVHVDDDTLCYLREHEAGSVLVTARRAGGPAVELPWDDATLLLSTEPYGPTVPGAASGGPVVTVHAV